LGAVLLRVLLQHHAQLADREVSPAVGGEEQAQLVYHARHRLL